MSDLLTAEQFRTAAKVRKKRGVLPTEARIHEAFCRYVSTKYPHFIFTSESSGIRFTMGQAVKAKKLRSSSKLPDFWLAEPRLIYHGFFMELKRSREEVYRKDGKLRDDERIQGQANILEQLRERGYCAEFGFGLDDCIAKLEGYLDGNFFYHSRP